jgi:uncharacterized protein (DUF58 family)
MLFDEAALRKLEQLSLVASRVRAGMMKGERRSTRRGTSIEFADYRNYSKGDDLRRLDWNVYARLERPFIKLLEEEEDLAVHLLLDASQSMAWPENSPEEKLAYGVRLAGALGHIALTAGDLVTVSMIRSDGNQRWGPYRGHQSSIRLFQFLEQGAAKGVTDLDQSLREYALRARRPGLLLLISDLLSPNGYRQGLNALQSRGYETGIIHLLSPDEVDPPPVGDVKLIDVETGQVTEITLDAGMTGFYRRRLEEWRAEIAAYCAGRQVHYVPVTTDIPWDELVLRTLRLRGVVS